MTKKIKSNELGRFQYLVTENEKSNIINSQENRVINSVHVYLGEKIDINISKWKSDRKILLIGDAVDVKGEVNWYEVSDWLCTSSSVDEMLVKSDRLCGAWVIFILTDGLEVVFSDAAGLLPVYYCSDNHDTTVSSSSSILASIFKRSKEQYYDLFSSNSKYFKPEYLKSGNWKGNASLRDTSWPLSLTPYKNIKKLIPNHYINLRNKKQYRFWPQKDLPKNSVNEAAKISSTLIGEASKQISNKYNSIYVPVTSGVDTRVLLSVISKIDVGIECFTYTTKKDVKNGINRIDMDRDVKVAKNICKTLGLKHETIEMSTDVSWDSVNGLFQNIDYLVSSRTIPYEFCTLKKYADDEGVCLNGNVSEIGRPYFAYGSLPIWSIDATLVSAITKRKNNSVSEAEFDPWVSEAKEIYSSFGIEPMDLLYWEERMGSWQSSFQQQMRPVWNIFTPYNCRLILETLLSVPYRKRVESQIYKKIVEINCPEIANIPYNPIYGQSNLSKLKMKIKKNLKKVARRNKLANYIWWKLNFLLDR
ncbi:hypothetical protein [Salinibacter ruber]|uniref:hypothetical protein n=1 Tax=Salinibacter ruber TaxID=146919 RepID=UPI0016203819|nr:hypothetical protein [Salinibacter ruber]MBB4091151.1 hypothetical protein [Salinibacter ruber]